MVPVEVEEEEMVECSKQAALEVEVVAEDVT